MDYYFLLLTNTIIVVKVPRAPRAIKYPNPGNGQVGPPNWQLGKSYPCCSVWQLYEYSKIVPFAVPETFDELREEYLSISIKDKKTGEEYKYDDYWQVF